MSAGINSSEIVQVAVGIVVDNMSPDLDPAMPREHDPDNAAQQDQAPRILITRRTADQVLAGLWELPGGKLEPDETAAQAVVRELHEEVGIEVTPIASLAPVEHRYDHAHVRLLPFICHLVAGTPQPLHVDEVRWVTADQLPDFAFPDASLPVLDELTQWLADNA
jgi:mutator protein MutT